MIGALIEFFSNWWVWGPIASVMAYLTWQNRRRARSASNTEHALLLLEIPRTNDKKELAAEQMFASLHGILRPKKELMREGVLQEHISFEIASINQQIRFYIWTPKHLQNFVEGQIYAQYPTVQIHEQTEDYADRDLSTQINNVTEITLSDNEVLPIKTFQNFEVDPLAAVTATLAKLDEGEELWIQILARPVDDIWHRRGTRAIERIRKGKGLKTVLDSHGFWSFVGYFGQVFEALWRPPEARGGAVATRELTERDKSRIAGIEEKSKKLGYQVKVRIAYNGPDKESARLRLQAMIGTFKQFNTTNLNGFTQMPTSNSIDKIAEYRARFFLDDGRILNIEELASLYHLPHTNVETPNIMWATSKTAEPPGNLPAVGIVEDQLLSPIGTTNFRGTNTQFGTKRSDRGRHLYVVGQTGVGKSGLLQLLTLSDIFADQGFAVIDPHGDYASEVLRYIPEHRIGDVVYFNPADTQYPIGFNPMEVFDPSLKSHISSELVGVLKRMFDSWGPRLEYILRYTILALLDHPHSTMLDITRMLTDKDFRAIVVADCSDPVVRNFWTNEFGSWNEKFASEAVAPVLNKVGAFTANPMIRNIIGQPQSSFNIRQLMDEGKILIVNLSRGLVGEDNAAILGALMVTKIQLAAMSRADIVNIEDRRGFYLYVDEFQNFATDSFAVILSEARKYGLNLTVANQYVSQMSDVVKSAVFGNVGSLISFRVGADDAGALQRYFEPQFDSQDLIQLHNRHFVASLSIDGEKTPAFSAVTLNLPQAQQDNSARIIEQSRQTYAQPRDMVTAQIVSLARPQTKIEHKTQAGHQHQKSQKPTHNSQRSASVKNAAHKPKNRKQAPKSQNHGSMREDEVISLR